MTSLTPDNTLLGLLAAQAAHGYQLIHCFRDPAHLGEVWNLSVSQLYAVLKRLEQQRLITGQQVETPDAPPRIEYTLTTAGWQRLECWLDIDPPSASVRAVRVEFLSRLYIARLLNRPTGPIVRRQKAACHNHLLQVGDLRAHAQPGIGLLALELRASQLEAILKWIDRCELVSPEDE